MELKFLVFMAFIIGDHWLAPMADTSYQRKPGDCSKRLKLGDTCAKRRPRLKWYYNTTSQTCLQFTYNGCNGNANRFASENACLRVCRPEGSPSISSATGQIPECDPYKGGTVGIAAGDQCSGRPEKGGSCAAKEAGYRWYFNSTSSSCSTFYYCGCDGNQNNFPDEETCLTACEPDTYSYEEYKKNLDNGKDDQA
uniref:BPTI/Kunitz inhibitor domain-containing protein n=1 Tax=Amblyomma triste TaxID=251400 RepID=A0A023G664_AMBTT